MNEITQHSFSVLPYLQLGEHGGGELYQVFTKSLIPRYLSIGGVKALHLKKDILLIRCIFQCARQDGAWPTGLAYICP